MTNYVLNFIAIAFPMYKIKKLHRNHLCFRFKIDEFCDNVIIVEIVTISGVFKIKVY